MTWDPLTTELVIHDGRGHVNVLVSWFCLWGLYLWMLIRSSENKFLLTLGFGFLLFIELYLIFFRWGELTISQKEATFLAGWLTPGFIVVVVVVAYFVHRRNGFKPEESPITKDLEDFERDPLDVWRV